MRVEFQVRNDLGHWNGHKPGEVIVVEDDRDVASQVAAGEAAGMLLNVEYDAEASEVRILTVEQTYDSLEKQRHAQQEGVWQEGNQLQFDLEHE